MKTLKILSAILVIAIITAFTINNTTSKGYKVGDYADDFSLKNIDNKMVSMADYKDAKGFIVIFTCNQCPYSKMYENRIIALDNKFKSKGYPVIAINPNDPAASLGDDFASMQQRAEIKGFTFPYLFDEGQKVYPKYGATKTPHVYLLNKDSEGLKVAYIGTIDNNARNEEKVSVSYVEDAVNALLTGGEIKNTNTKAIGCSIKTL
ncbi:MULTISPECIES: thioredoxin family protein [Tenacibaculum]|uniref:thioredoxin family protein n=1 Tax=Tenacibaculum TaxID=104267 RepID=UPI001F0ACD1C|nr:MULTISPECIES: thioredoxin family protein [Tenacibaculum]MCH3883074.1 thioredoxin family protein [Tenacibaculum aquimarinum]MDO6600569.1 thioredoxin family protein [Tenacibaculum sp. 1_MG-2023]